MVLASGILSEMILGLGSFVGLRFGTYFGRQRGRRCAIVKVYILYLAPLMYGAGVFDEGYICVGWLCVHYPSVLNQLDRLPNPTPLVSPDLDS